MQINNVNLNQLRIFAAVYRTRSMTEASKELHLTQSGVSQHVKSLEDVLGVTLFDRVKQRLIPTSASSLLYQKCTEGLYGIEQALSEIKDGEKQLSGTVSIGMPIEFGNNMIAPLLSRFGRQHERVRFALRYGFATEMSDALVRGELDFAFVDEFGIDKRLHIQPVYDETLQLCATREFLKRFGAIRETREYFESLEYIDYQPGEPVLRLWFNHHLGKRKINLVSRANVMDVQGVARLILSDLGAGVLPDHLISKLGVEAGSRLHVFKGSSRPVKNRISMAFLPERTRSPASLAAFEFLAQSITA